MLELLFHKFLDFLEYCTRLYRGILILEHKLEDVQIVTPKQSKFFQFRKYSTIAEWITLWEQTIQTEQLFGINLF